MANFFDASEMAEEIEEAREIGVHESGEVSLRLTGFREGDEGIIRTNKNGNPFILPMFEIFGEDEEYREISHYVPIPSASIKDKKERRRVNLAWKRFCEAMGQDPTDRVDFLDMVGEDTEALIDVKEDEGYGEQNNIIRFVNKK